MSHPYNELYLGDAMQNLGEAIDVACNCQHMDPDYFMDLFVCSGIAYQFESGNPKYIAGRSGTELVLDVLYKIYGKEVPHNYDLSYSDPSPEYWAGWVLAYYQWQYNHSFRDIQKSTPIKNIILKYHPYHEADESKIAEYLDKNYEEYKRTNRLQAYRKLISASQKELAEKSGVNLRTLQQYEINAKDIRKASVSTVKSLSSVIGCSIEDLSS